MEKIDKIKKIIYIILGFILSGYLIYSGFDILTTAQNNQENKDPKTLTK